MDELASESSSESELSAAEDDQPSSRPTPTLPHKDKQASSSSPKKIKREGGSERGSPGIGWTRAPLVCTECRRRLVRPTDRARRRDEARAER